jgi:predicted esterase
MKERALCTVSAILFAAALGAGCDHFKSHKDDTPSLMAMLAIYSGNFSLVNSQTSPSSRLDILFYKTFSGTISYILSKTDLKITNPAEFSASAAAKTTVTITADDQIYNDYIAISSLSSNTTYYVYILNSDTGLLTVLSRATKASATSSQETGTLSGYSGTITWYLNFPAGYDTAQWTAWPLVISIKAPNFTANDANFPCITFNTDVTGGSYDQMVYDVERIKEKLNSIIENPAYRINKSRIYGCGFSAGGCAMMKIANNDGSSQYKLIALAVNGISGWLGTNADWTGNLGDTNIWISRGETDTYGADVAHANMPKTSGDHLLSIYPGVGHDSSPTWASPYTFSWLLSK